MNNNLRSVLIFAKTNKNLIFGLLVLALILLIDFQCVTNGKACDGDPTLDPNNNCLPFTSTTTKPDQIAPTNLEANKRCYENPPQRGYVFRIETFDDLERLSFCSKIENSTEDYLSKWLDADYVILKDIDADAKNWNPIATSVDKGGDTLPFRGSLKGNCGETGLSPCKILNLNINSSISNSSKFAGLIGNAKGVVIENLIFEKPIIAVSNSESTGVLIANLSNGNKVSIISNIKLNNPRINSNNGKVGSLIGSISSNPSTTTINNVLVSELELTADGDNVGGLVGSASGLTLDLAKINVKVLTGGNSTGGFIGNATGTIILTNFYTNGTGITGKNNVGGLIGNTSAITGDSKIESFYTAFDNPIKFSGVAGGIIGAYYTNLKIGKGFSANLLNHISGGGGIIGECSADNLRAINAPIYFNQDATSIKGNVFGANCGSTESQYVYPVSSVFLRDNLYEQLDITKKKGVVSLKFDPKIWGAMGTRGSYPCLNELDSSSAFNTSVTSSSLSAPTPKECAPNINATIDYTPGLSAFTTEYKILQCLSECLNDYKYPQIYLNWTKNEDPSTNYKISLLKLDNIGKWNTVYFANSTYEHEESENAYNLELTGSDYGIYKINLSACLDKACAIPTAPIQFILPSFSTNGDITLTTQTLSNWNTSTIYRNSNWGNGFSDGDVTISWSSSSNMKYYKIGIKIWGKDEVNPSFSNSQTGDMKCIFSNIDNSNIWKVDSSRFNNVKEREANDKFCKAFTNIPLSKIENGKFEVKLNDAREGVNFSVFVAPCKNTCGVWGVANNSNSKIVTTPFENSDTSKIVLTISSSSTTQDIQNGNIKLSYNLTQLRETVYSLVLLESVNNSTNWSIIKTLDDPSSSDPISMSKNLSGSFNYKIKPCTIINEVIIGCGKESDVVNITINSVGVVTDVWSTVSSNYINSFIQDRANKSSTLYVGSSGRKFDLMWYSIIASNTGIRYEIEEVNNTNISWFSVIDKNGKYINSKKQVDGYTCDKGVCTLKFELGLFDKIDSDNIIFNIRACRNNICDVKVNTFTLNLKRISLPEKYDPDLHVSNEDLFNSIKVNNLGHIEIPKYCHDISGARCNDGDNIDKPYGVDFYQIGAFNENDELLAVNTSSSLANRTSNKPVSLGPIILPLGKLKFKLRFCVIGDESTPNNDNTNCSDWSIDTPAGGFTPKIPINLSIKSINGADATQVKTGEYYVLVWQSLEKIDKFLVTQNYKNDGELFEKSWLIWKSNNKFSAKLINDDTCIESSANCKENDFPKVTWLSVKENKINLAFRNIGWATYTYAIKTCPNSVNSNLDSFDCSKVSDSSSNLLVTISTITNLQISTILEDGGTVKNNNGTYYNYSSIYKITWKTLAKSDVDYFYKIKGKQNEDDREFEIDVNGDVNSYINETRFLPGTLTYSIYTCTLVGCIEQASIVPKVLLEIKKAGTIPANNSIDNNVTLTYNSVMSVGGYWDFGNTGYAFTTGNNQADLKFKWKSVEGYKVFALYWKTADQNTFVRNGTILEGLPLLNWNSLEIPVSGNAFFEKSVLWYTSSISKSVLPKGTFGFVMRYCFYDCEKEEISYPTINWSNAYKVKVYSLAKADAIGFYLQDVDALKINFFPNLIINNKNSIFSKNPLLSWLNFNSANSYNLRWSSNNGQTWSDIKHYSLTSNYIPLPSGNYTFMLQPCDDNGACGAWSITQNINIKANCDENDPDKEIPSYISGGLANSITNCSVVNNTKICLPSGITSRFNNDTNYYTCSTNGTLTLVNRGNGTINNPFLIYNVAHLQNIRNNVVATTTQNTSTLTAPTIYYKLAQDINAATAKTLNTLPISFTGSLDGDNLKISSLKIAGGGIFREIGKVGVIKNIVFKNIKSASGLLANTNWGTIKEVGVNSIKINATSGGGIAVGGLVNTNNTSGSISRSYVMGVVRGVLNVGGIAGLNLGNIDNSYSLGSVSGISRVGGLVGQNGTSNNWNVYVCDFGFSGKYLGDQYLYAKANSSYNEFSNECNKYQVNNGGIYIIPRANNVTKLVNFYCRGKEVTFDIEKIKSGTLTQYRDIRSVGVDKLFHSGVAPESEITNNEVLKFCQNKANQIIDNYTTEAKDYCPYDGFAGSTCRYNDSYNKVHSTKKREYKYDVISVNTSDAAYNASLDTYNVNKENLRVASLNNPTSNYNYENYTGTYKTKAFYCLGGNGKVLNSNPFYLYGLKSKDINNNINKDAFNDPINETKYYLYFSGENVNGDVINGYVLENHEKYGRNAYCKSNYSDNDANSYIFGDGSFNLRTWYCYKNDYTQVGSVNLPSNDTSDDIIPNTDSDYSVTNNTYNNYIKQMCSKQTGVLIASIAYVDYRSYELAPTSIISGSISNSYSAAVVKGSGLVGGLVGLMANAKTVANFIKPIVNSFWDLQVSGQKNGCTEINANGIVACTTTAGISASNGLSSEKMKNTTDTSSIGDGKKLGSNFEYSSSNAFYPKIKGADGKFQDYQDELYPGCDRVETNKIAINNADDLFAVRWRAEGICTGFNGYKLNADIDLAESIYSENWDSIDIGVQNSTSLITFDGNDRIVKNLKIKDDVSTKITHYVGSATDPLGLLIFLQIKLVFLD